MKKAHFSIDDVGLSFRYLYRNKPKSIFDLRLYSQLLNWHEKYGLVANLFCIVRIEDFCISDLPTMYRTEFENNADWLKFGFHSGNEFSFLEDYDYKNSYEKAEYFFENMSMGQTKAIRLHSWNATDEQELFLKSRGVETLFMPNENDYMYDGNGVYIKNGIIHHRTDLWFEKMGEISDEKLATNKDFIVMFTHEWCFDEQKSRIDKALSFFYDNGFRYI